MKPNASLSADAAEALAIDALGALASDPEQLGRFLSLTGIGPQDLREMAHQHSFLSAVLDHILADEGLTLSVSSNQGHHPAQLEAARIVLGGHFDQ